MNYQNNQITEIRQEIDHIREYVDSDLCKKCEEMQIRLKQCENLLNEYARQDMDNLKSDS